MRKYARNVTHAQATIVGLPQHPDAQREIPMTRFLVLSHSIEISQRLGVKVHAEDVSCADLRLLRTCVSGTRAHEIRHDFA